MINGSISLTTPCSSTSSHPLLPPTSLLKLKQTYFSAFLYLTYHLITVPSLLNTLFMFLFLRNYSLPVFLPFQLFSEHPQTQACTHVCRHMYTHTRINIPNNDLSAISDICIYNKLPASGLHVYNQQAPQTKPFPTLPSSFSLSNL